MSRSNTVYQVLAAIRIGITNAEQRFKEGGCFQLYLVLKELFPQAVAWYDPIEGHVYAEIDGGYYDINGHHERGERWELLKAEPLRYAKAHDWDFK